jgi:hypothetical protein
MKKLFLILIMVLPLLFSECSKNGDPSNPWPSYLDAPFPGELKMNGVNLDTVTPPINPLHPLSPGVAELPCYYGYLDCARYANDKRYCALIGMGEGQNIYFLADDEWKTIRYNSPILADCHVGELLYIRGYLKTDEKRHYFLLQVVDIEKTDSIVVLEPNYYFLDD